MASGTVRCIPFALYSIRMLHLAEKEGPVSQPLRSADQDAQASQLTLAQTTEVARRSCQLMNLSTRNATELVCHMLTRFGAPVGVVLSMFGASSMSREAWSDIETWIPPSSPRKISSPLISATTGPSVSVGTYCDVNTGRPASVPPFGVMPGNAGAPTSLVASDRSIATVSGMTQNAPETDRLLPTSSFRN